MSLEAFLAYASEWLIAICKVEAFCILIMGSVSAEDQAWSCLSPGMVLLAYRMRLTLTNSILDALFR